MTQSSISVRSENARISFCPLSDDSFGLPVVPLVSECQGIQVSPSLQRELQKMF